MYESGSQDGPPMTIPVDQQLSFRWSLAAAKQENVNAMMITGHAYLFGRGVEQNDKTAFEWLMKAAETDDSTILSICSLRGYNFMKIAAVRPNQ